MSTSRLTELLPQLQDNRQLETFWALKCGRQDLYVKCLWRCLSPNTQAVLDLCIALLDSLSTLLPATLRECGNLRSSRTGNLGRGRQYLLTIFLLLPRESSDLDTVLWTRHRLPLRKSRDWRPQMFSRGGPRTWTRAPVYPRHFCFSKLTSSQYVNT